MLENECQFLLKTPANEIETTLIILTSALPEFLDYWNFIEQAEDQLLQLGHEGVFQVASFHPAYLFGGSTEEDPANFTNRSPFPMLHLLREDSLSAALANHKNPEAIPERNIALMQEKGKQHWVDLLRRIKNE